MVCNISDFDKIILENPMGGKGKLTKTNLLGKDNLGKKVSTFAIINLDPHSTLGLHQHVGTCEGYYFIKGSAKYVDDDKTIAVKAGDFTMCDDGHFHSVINDSDEEVSFVALILE